MCEESKKNRFFKLKKGFKTIARLFGKICKFLRIPIVKNGLIIVLACLLSLFLLIYNNSYFQTSIMKSSMYELLLQLLLMGITLGLGTVIYGCFDVISFFKNQIKEILIEDDYLKKLSRAKKEELKTKLENDLVYNGYKPQPDCLYTFVKNKIEPLVKNCFFKVYSCEIFCEYKENENTIHKHMNYNLVVSHIDPNESVTFDINSQICTCYEDNPLNSLKIEKLTIGNNSYEDKVELVENMISDDGKGYTKAYSLNDMPQELIDDLTFSDKDLAINISLLSIVTEDDLSYSNRLSCPCSNFDFTFIYNDKQFAAYPNVFCFMDTAEGTRPRWSLKKTTKMSDIVDIDVNVAGWMLPGDGVSITLDKK